MNAMKWSDYQLAIYDAVRDTSDSLLIEAVAGSGKTTTLVEAIRHVPPGGKVAFLAFNKAIAAELGRRVDLRQARCMTLHSAGWNAWRQHLAWDAGECKVDGGKVQQVIRDTLTWDERKANPALGKVVGLAKASGIVPAMPSSYVGDTVSYLNGLAPDDDDTWLDLMDHHGISPDDCQLELARRVLAESIARSREVVDFDDMLYLPVVAGAAFERFDTVFVDEAQDLSGIQHVMLERMAAVGGAASIAAFGRVVAVGDRHQAIYGFRGAHASSMDALKDRFACRELPLSVSYRCPLAVVDHARQWCPQIEAAASAAAGLVEGSGEEPAAWQLRQYAPGDAILCRVNRPLVATAFRLIGARVPARVLGRDIGQGLAALAKKLAGALHPGAAGFKAGMLDALAAYRTRERERLVRRKQWAALAALDDRVATLGIFVAELGAGAGAAELVAEIESLFGDAGAAGAAAWRGVTLATVHKAKGLEWPRVFILDAGEWMPGPWARRGWELEQERNIQYVAATRAGRELRYVSSHEAVAAVDVPSWETPEEPPLEENSFEVEP